jgi:hypothetical protein
MMRKRPLLFLVLMCMLVLPAFASAAVLWDQPLNTTGDPVNQQAYFSQEYTNDDDSDIWTADDFVNNRVWEISTIFVPGDFRLPEGTETLLDAVALNWEIYADSSGVPDGDPSGGGNAPFWSISVPVTDTQVTITTGTPGGYPSDARIDLTTPVILPPGTWWLVFYPAIPNTEVYGRQPSATTNNYEAQVVQPLGGDGYPTVWTSVLDTMWPADRFPIPLTQQDFAFRIEGTILFPDIAVDPVTLNFGAVLVDQTSITQTVTISNTGEANLYIESIAITGTSASMFAVVPGGTCGDAPVTITSQNSCTVVINFTPSAAGSQSAALVIRSDDPDVAALQVALSGAGTQALPSVIEGTIGTVITFTPAPLSSFGEKKGKVLIGGVATKIAKAGWTPTEITCTLKKVPVPAETQYNIAIQPKPKGTPELFAGTFTVRKPQIDPDLSDKNGAPDTEATIRGLWFGTKKGKVYLGDYKPKVKSWTMNPTTGESTIVFVVPKKIGAATYALEVDNKIGRSLTTFTTP